MSAKPTARSLLAMVVMLLASAPTGWAFDLLTHQEITGAAFDRSTISDSLRDLGIDPRMRLKGGLFSSSRMMMVSGASWGSGVGPGNTLLLALGMMLGAQMEALPPLTYSAKQVQGVVVDAATGEPLEGVIVVAQWVLHEPGPGSWRRLHVFETTTDSAGRYLIPGWGPKRNPWYPWTRLRDEDPRLSFFKSGYFAPTIQNRWDRNESIRFSEWDGKTLKLQKFTGTDEDWIKELSFLQTDLAWGDEVMEWRRMPRIVLALEKERLILEQKHRLKVSTYLSPLSTLGTTIEEARRFLEGQK